MGEGSSVDEESWKRGLRARVTALKCHVMASKGLTSQGYVVPAYSPEVLYKEPHNAAILSQYNKPKDIRAYVAGAMKNSNKSDSHNKQDETDSSLHPKDVQLEFVDSSDTDRQKNSGDQITQHQDDKNSESDIHSNLKKQNTSQTEESPITTDNISNKATVNNAKLHSDSRNLSCVSNDKFESNTNNNITFDAKELELWNEVSAQTPAGDSDDDDSSPAEVNGYIRVSAECDEFDVLSDDTDNSAPVTPAPTQHRGNGNNSSKCSGSEDSTTSTSLSNSDSTSFVCERGGKSSCLCCKTHCPHIAELKDKVRNQEQEVTKLSSIRDEVENELQELTANLFQEAHSMVTAANQRSAAAEKSLTEAKMAVDVLTGEVTALKAMVITSTPAAPNPHLHPQLHFSSNGSKNGSSNSNHHSLHSDTALSSAVASSSAAGATAITGSSSNVPSGTASLPINVSAAGLRIFQRGHKKSPSDFDLKYGRDTTPPSSPHKGGIVPLVPSGLDPDCWEVDPVCHREFIAWHQNGSLTDFTDPFLRRVYEEDMSLCLSFPNVTLGHAVGKAVQDNDIFIEEVNARHQHTTPSKCVLLEVARFCKYRFRLGSKQPYTWYYISQLARNRIIAVCDFLNYLRYIKQGLVKSSIHDMYWEVVKLRRQMALARLGF